MPDNVIEAPFVTTLPIPVERILRKAVEADLESVLVVGYTKDGEFYFAASLGGGPENLWALERAKRELLEISRN